MLPTIAKLIQGIGAVIIGIALLWGLYIASDFLNNGVVGRTISVTGKARRSLVQNESTVLGTWEAKAVTSEEARNQTRESTAKALAAIKANGIEEKKITTTQVSVNPEYNWQAGRNKITGYRASTSLEVKLTDPKKADEIISLMTKNGANYTSGPQLGFSNAILDQMEKELQAEAVTEAKKQAKILAQEAGAKLGRVVSIGRGGISSPNDRGIYPLAMTDELKAPASDSSDISIGEKEMTATISITYQLK